MDIITLIFIICQKYLKMLLLHFVPPEGEQPWYKSPIVKKLGYLVGFVGMAAVLIGCELAGSDQILTPDAPIDPTTQLPTNTLVLPITTEIIKSPTLESTLPPTKAIPSPSPTIDPMGDPDGDGHPTKYEDMWGTDPFTFTSFDDLAVHPGTIYAKMRVSQPFDVDDMNGTLYQVVRVIEIQDNGTPDNPSDDHLVFEVVLFPYARYSWGDITTQVDQFPIDSNSYPEEIRPYLDSTEISNITPEMRETMLDVVNGAYSNIDAILKIKSWNRSNLTVNEDWKQSYYKEIINYSAGEMFNQRQTRWSTTRSTLLTAQLRAIGFPTQMIFGVMTNPETSSLAMNHPQNLVYLNHEWVRLDYVHGLNYQPSIEDEFSYSFLVFTDIFTDTSLIDHSAYIHIIDVLNDINECKELHNSLKFRINN